MPRGEDVRKKQEFITKIIIFKKILPKITKNNQKRRGKVYDVSDFSFESKSISIENRQKRGIMTHCVKMTQVVGHFDTVWAADTAAVSINF